jgi:outer membrane protein TolC
VSRAARRPALALLALVAGGCAAWRAEVRRFDEGPETAFYREQSVRAAAAPTAPAAPAVPSAVPPGADLEARGDGWRRRTGTRDELEGLLSRGDERTASLLEAAATDEATEQALAAAPLDLETVRVLAAVRAPSVRAARESWRATIEQFDQAAWLEDLLTAFRPFTRSLDTRVGEQPQQGMTSAFSPWPSTVALRGEMAEAEVAMAHQMTRAAAAEAMAAVEEAWFEQWHAEESLRLKRGFLDVLRLMAEAAARRYAAGKGMQEEAVRVEVQVADLRADLARHTAERASAVAKQNTLLSRPGEAPLPEAAAPRFPDEIPAMERAAAAARDRSAMALSKAAAADEARIALRMAEVMLHPGPAAPARLESGPDRGMEMPSGAPLVEAALSTGSEEAYLRELRLRVSAAEAEREAARRGAESMAAEAWTTLDTALREVRVKDRTAIPLARQVFEVSERAYETGAEGLAEHLQAWWMYVEARHGAVEARMRAGFARAALLRAAGAEVTERPR